MITTYIANVTITFYARSSYCRGDFICREIYNYAALPSMNLQNHHYIVYFPGLKKSSATLAISA